MVVVLCGELLNLADALIRGGVHPSEIISGYSMAYRELKEILPTLAVPVEIDLRSPESLAKGVFAAIASKQYGVEDVLAPLVATACAMLTVGEATTPACCSVMPREPSTSHRAPRRWCTSTT